MGQASSRDEHEAAGRQLIGRLPAVGEATRKAKTGAQALPPNAKLADPSDLPRIQVLLNFLIFLTMSLDI